MKRISNQRAAKSWQKKKKKSRISFHLHLPKKAPSKKMAITLGLLLFTLVAAYTLLFSGYFQVKKVSINGNQSLSRDEIEKMVRSSLTEKNRDAIPADNYFALNTAETEKKISTSFNEVESVKITKDFPDGITVAIQEKNPALIWCRKECYFVNEQGIAFLPANEAEMVSQSKHFIKIMEESVIAEETAAEQAAMAQNIKQNSVPAAAKNEQAGDVATATEEADSVSADTSSPLPAITLNEQVADESFIKFTLDINSRLSYNAKFKIKYYKTKGYRTRELIAFTDKNTKLYFDTTVSAEKQANNLNTVLDKSVAKDQVDSLQYVYLKNEDRVFYK